MYVVASRTFSRCETLLLPFTIELAGAVVLAPFRRRLLAGSNASLSPSIHTMCHNGINRSLGQPPAMT